MKIVDHWLQADTPQEKVRVSPSQNARPPIDPDYLILHYTATDTAADAINWFMNTQSNPDRIAAHIVLDYDGTITQLIPFNCRANHAGYSIWDGASEFNYHSIGIEIVNPGYVEKMDDGSYRRAKGKVNGKMVYKTYPASSASSIVAAQHKHRFWNAKDNQHWFVFPPAQLEALYTLSKTLIDKYQLITALGHDDIAAGRKPDPGPAFPWDTFRTRLNGTASPIGKVFVTNQHGVNFRSSHSTTSTVIKTLSQGYEVGLIETNGQWSKVYLVQKQTEVVDNGRSVKVVGWIHSSLLTPKA
ncbi:N-acetylmuramoyl-L-alanine amidase [Chitinophaga agrisoli]|nr:N-acetylmuramoyl-L-alanine amidase [Chitinophaga agrisoli]